MLPKTVTIGSAVAEDTKLVFDGNAQDFHIGLDDSADDLVIGKGSALGTTTHMSFDENGAILKPLQPAFLAQPASAQLNLATDSNVAIVLGTERFDQGGDFASNTFTAPVTGRYQLCANLYLSHIPHQNNWHQFNLVTSNRTYKSISEPQSGGDNTYNTVQVNVLCDMDANDTASLNLYLDSGSAQVDVNTDSHFSGYLAC